MTVYVILPYSAKAPGVYNTLLARQLPHLCFVLFPLSALLAWCCMRRAQETKP